MVSTPKDVVHQQLYRHDDTRQYVNKLAIKSDIAGYYCLYDWQAIVNL